MKLSISNIAWSVEQDEAIYKIMKELGYQGLEIAPSRIFPRNPYEHVSEAVEWAKEIKQTYGFSISSLQSIWFGRQERLFGSKEERNILLAYTKQAIDFASALGCKNLVFGCPKNRYIQNEKDYDVAIDFFRTLGDYAAKNNTCIGMEANPPIYNTNFINTTQEAIQIVKDVDSEGFKLNLDLGTMIENNEGLDVLENEYCLINHVHISEPGLEVVKARTIHAELINKLRNSLYVGFVSIEMGNKEEVCVVEETIKYLKQIEKCG